MGIGLRELPGTRSLSVLGMLALPFRNLRSAVGSQDNRQSEPRDLAALVEPGTIER
jgi:hypothetical protein